MCGARSAHTHRAPQQQPAVATAWQAEVVAAAAQVLAASDQHELPPCRVLPDEAQSVPARALRGQVQPVDAAPCSAAAGRSQQMGHRRAGAQRAPAADCAQDSCECAQRGLAPPLGCASAQRAVVRPGAKRAHRHPVLAGGYVCSRLLMIWGYEQINRGKMCSLFENGNGEGTDMRKVAHLGTKRERELVPELVFVGFRNHDTVVLHFELQSSNHSSRAL